MDLLWSGGGIAVAERQFACYRIGAVVGLGLHCFSDDLQYGAASRAKCSRLKAGGFACLGEVLQQLVDCDA